MAGEEKVLDGDNQTSAAEATTGETAPVRISARDIASGVAKQDVKLDQEGEPPDDDPDLFGESDDDDSEGEGKQGVPSDPILEALSKVGLKHDFKTGDDAIKSLVEARKKLSTRDELAKLGEVVAPRWQEIQAYLASRAQGGQQQPTQQPAEPAWSPPQLPTGWEAEMEKPEGQRSAAIVAAVQQYEAYVRGKWTDYFRNPSRFFEEHVQPRLAEVLQAREAQAQEASLTDAALQEAAQAMKDNLDLVTESQEEIRKMLTDPNPMRRVTIPVAIELIKARKQAAAADAQQAKAKDVQAAAGKAGQSRPRGASQAHDGLGYDGGLDARAIGLAQLRAAGMSTADR
jgi:hypothetical protein